MQKMIPLAMLTAAFAAPVYAQPLNPPANLYLVSNMRTDLVAAFPSLDRCQAAAAAHKTILIGNGPVPALFVCVPTQ